MEKDLDSHKAEILATFQSLSGIADVQQCRDILERNQWNISSATQEYRTRNNFNDHTNSNNNHQIGTNNVNNNRIGWWQFGYSLINAAFSMVLSILGTLFPGQAEPNPDAAAQQLENLIGSKYGRPYPTLYKGSYRDAINKAKQEFKFLVIYLHSELHSNTSGFCREVLCTEIVSEFLNEHFIVWGGDVSTSEGFKVSIELAASSYPFFAVICNHHLQTQGGHRPSVRVGLTILDKIQGFIKTEDLIIRLSNVLDTFGPVLIAAKAEEEERRRERNLVRQQDDAFKQALEADREKEKKKKEEEERSKRQQAEAERAEKEKEFYSERRKREKEEKLKQLPIEPSSAEKDLSLVRIFLTNGSRIQLRFRASDTLQVVFDFVDSQEPSLEKIKLVSNYPRREFLDLTPTLKDVHLYPQAVLHVEEEFVQA